MALQSTIAYPVILVDIIYFKKEVAPHSALKLVIILIQETLQLQFAPCVIQTALNVLDLFKLNVLSANKENS